jgi:hypothetical protein
MLSAMQGVDVLHFVAAMTLALFVVRGLQAIGEHYFPSSGAVTAARYVYGGPS